MASGPPAGNIPADTIFVGNLSYDVTEKDVVDFFSQVGAVKTVRIVTERDTGKPRGFCFVEFYDIATADSAVRNLSGTEFNGRTIRCTFSEGGPGEFRGGGRRDDNRPPDRGFPHGGRGPPPGPSARDKVVGPDLSYHSQRGVATLLGAPAPPGAPADAITVLLARKSRGELYEALAQVQALAQREPGAARALLSGNPGLAKALFQAQVVLGMVGNPLGDVAPKGAAPPGMLSGRPHAEPEPGPPPAAHGYGGPPPQQQASGVPGGYGAPPPMHGPPSTMGGPPPYMQQPPQAQPLYGQPAEQPPPQMGVVPPAPAYPADPRLAPPTDPRLLAAPAPAAPGPRPMISLAAPAAAPVQPAAAVPVAAPGAPALAGMAPEQQQALLQQVLSLTPQQIELLPPQQRAQVQALQAQLRAQG